MKFHYALAASTLALGITITGAPVRANTVTDLVTFDIKDAYGQFGVVGYSSLAEATGSFNITFDPAKLYPASGVGSQSISGAVTFLSLTVTNPNPLLFGLSFSPSDIKFFKYDGGTLTLSSDSPTPKTLTNAAYITIGINGFGFLNPAADVWYSLSGLRDAVTSSGGPDSVTIQQIRETVTTTPLPSTWTMLIAGVVGLGFLAYRGSKKRTAVIASA